MTGCYGQFWSPAGASMCHLCEDGYTSGPSTGNTDCTVCAENEYVLDNQCVADQTCSAETDDDGVWSSALVGYQSEIYVNNDEVIGYMTKQCVLGPQGPHFEVVDKTHLLPKTISEGHSIIDLTYVFNNLAIYHVTPETELLIARAIVYTYAHRLGGFHDNALVYTFEHGVYTVSVHVRLHSNFISLSALEKFVPHSIHKMGYYLSKQDPIMFHQFVYVTVPGYVDSMSLTSACTAPDSDIQSYLTEYRYDSCGENFRGVVSYRCLQRKFESYYSRASWSCKPITPVAGHTFIDVTYDIRNVYASKFSCGIQSRFRRYLLRALDAVLYNFDVYQYKESYSENMPVTSFTIRAEVLSDQKLQVFEAIKSLDDGIYDILVSGMKFSSDIVVMLNDEESGYVDGAAQFVRRRLRA